MGGACGSIELMDFSNRIIAEEHTNLLFAARQLDQVTLASKVTIMDKACGSIELMDFSNRIIAEEPKESAFCSSSVRPINCGL